MKSAPLFASVLLLAATSVFGDDPKKLQSYDARTLGIEGKGWADTERFFDRFPARAQKTLPVNVWNIGRNSAGMCVHFTTDATSIAARWTLRNEGLAMAHMPATGVSGLDLYVKEQGTWRWLANGRPEQFPTNEKPLAASLPAERREYLLYLPLYNGVEDVQILVPAEATLESSARTNSRPIVFYGTSIVQGACASRPGMAYTAILGRRLDRPVLNFGFSGSALCEPELATVLAELDPVVYVIDPLPNMTPALVAERMEPFIKTLRRAHPQTPIVLVEGLEYPDGVLMKTRRESYRKANAELHTVFKRLSDAGERKLFYVPAKELIGDDGEATVDGTHPTDLGFMRIADQLDPVLRKALKAAR
jgi:hypothetical protein